MTETPQELFERIVEAAMSKATLELQVRAKRQPSERDLAMIRAAIGIGVTETFMQLKALNKAR